MRKLYLLVLTAAALLAAPGIRAAGIPWAKSIDAAMSEAKRTNKLVMIDFYADWCGWCKRLDAEVYTDAAVIRAVQQVIPVRANAEKEGLTTARRYGAAALPTIVFINQRGALIGKISGFEYAPTFTQSVTSFVSLHSQLPSLEQQFRAKPQAKSAAQLAETYAREADPPKAIAMLDEVRKMDPTGSKGYLASSTLCVGGMYEQSGNFTEAVSMFRTVLKVKGTDTERAYAHISLAECSLHQHKISPAIPELKATLALTGCPPPLRQAAQGYLNQIERMQSQGH